MAWIQEDFEGSGRIEARIGAPASRPSYRHTRTCSGYLSQAAQPDGRMDTRNKSGYDGEACPELVEGGRSGLTGKGWTADAVRSRNPVRLPRWLNRTAVEQVRA